MSTESAIPMKAFSGEQPCQLVSYHAPQPVMTEFHHQKPVYLQHRLYGEVRFPPSLWLCGNCHDAVHAWLYWLLGEHREPPRVGRAAKLEAQSTFDWYTSELQKGTT